MESGLQFGTDEKEIQNHQSGTKGVRHRIQRWGPIPVSLAKFDDWPLISFTNFVNVILLLLYCLLAQRSVQLSNPVITLTNSD